MKVKENKAIVFLVLLFLALFFLPLKKIDWGKLQWKNPETITVVGEAKSVQKNQIASYTAGVDSVQSDKDKAVTEVNTKVAALIKVVKDFGVAESDIKTQNMSVYQQEEFFTEDGVQRSRKGQWRVSNSIEIILRDVNKAAELATLLTSTGANNIYGPNFSFDDVSSVEKDLYSKSVADAKDKANILAGVSGRKLGKIVSIVEGGGNNNSIYSAKMADGLGGGGGVPVEIGSGTVSQSLTVVFELE